MNHQRRVYKVLFYIAGLFILALGVALSVNSDLGVSPVNSLPYVLSLVSGWELGSCVSLIFSGYILVQILILRRDFRWINLTQILFSTLFGYFVDVAKHLLGDFQLPGYGGRLVMMALSIFLVAAGISIYVDAGLINMPMEGVTAAIAQTWKGRSFHQIKVLLDCLVVAAAVGLSLWKLGGVYGVREGTVLCALLAGRVMKPIQRVAQPLVGRFCNPLPATPTDNQEGNRQP